MTMGYNIKRMRELRGFTQEGLAECLDLSFQAVSSWERDESKPDTQNLIRLAKCLDVSISKLTEESLGLFEDKKTIFDWRHMKTYIKTTAKHLKLDNTLKALEFAQQAHQHQTRKRSSVPYIYHPLNLVCHALAMKIEEDEILAACLLHDVIEDCGISLEAFPVNAETRQLVKLMTHSKTTDANRKLILDEYYEGLVANPKAALIKCLDRCNNLTTMSWGLSRQRMYRMIVETEHYYPDLFKILKQQTDYSNAAWLLQYQMESMLDIYKRLL